MLDTRNIIKNYLKGSDWEEKENANMMYSLQGLRQNIDSKAVRDFWLHNVYTKPIREAIEGGYIHIHDLDFLGAYCCGWDVLSILKQGFRGCDSKVVSTPPSHFRTALGILVNFLYTTQGESAGAQSLSNVDIYLAPYIRKDNLSYEEVKRFVRSFIYNLNIPTRTGFQTPFTNLSIGLTIPKHMKNEKVWVGEYLNSYYGDYQKEVDVFNKAFNEVMLEGDGIGNPFAYPIPNYSITPDFNWDSEIATLICENAAKNGSPYFSNFINSDLKPEDVKSMCPLTRETEVLVREDGVISSKSIEDIANSNKLVDVYYKGDWSKATPVKVPMTDVLEIKLNNGISVQIGVNHLQPTKLHGTLCAKDLQVGMELPFHKIFKKPFYLSKKIYYTTITSIDKIEVDDKFLYCLEVYNDSNLFMLSTGLLTHNCRLRLDLRELQSKGGGLFGSNPLTGSMGVVTLNLPLLGYISKTKADLLKNIKKYTDIARESLYLKRSFVEHHTRSARTLYPYCKHYLTGVYKSKGGYWANHFNTIGIIGLEECLLNFKPLGVSLLSREGKDFGEDILKYINGLLSSYQVEDEDLVYNLEATPGEGTSYRLAKRSKELYPDLITQGGVDTPYFTNSSLLPAKLEIDIFDAVEHQESLQKLYTGGTVFHALTESITPLVAKDLLKRLLNNTHLPYITISPVYSICPIDGYLEGEVSICPKCGNSTVVYSRVVGFYRAVYNFNIGKAEEYRERSLYKLGDKDV